MKKRKHKAAKAAKKAQGKPALSKYEAKRVWPPLESSNAKQQ